MIANNDVRDEPLRAAVDAELTPLTYHSYTAAVSNSMLKVFNRSRRDYEATYILGTKKQESPNRGADLGTVLHAFLRCPADLRIDPQWEAVQEWRPVWEALQSLKEPLDAGELKRVDGMRTALLNNPKARLLLWDLPGKAERIIKWYDAEFGLWRKAMIDRLLERLPTGGRLFADLKNIELWKSETLQEGIKRAAKKYGYFRQLAYYEDGARTVADEHWPAILIAVASVPDDKGRHAVGCYDCTESEWGQKRHERAMEANHESLRELATCYLEGDWADLEETEIVEL